YRVTGEGYDPSGSFHDEEGREITTLPAPLSYTLATAALCNNAQLDVDPETKRWRIVGDPTEGALLTVAAKGKLSRDNIAPTHKVLQELPFDSDRKRMTVVTRDNRGREIAHVKGSVDVLLPLCTNFSSEAGPRPLTD